MIKHTKRSLFFLILSISIGACASLNIKATNTLESQATATAIVKLGNLDRTVERLNVEKTSNAVATREGKATASAPVSSSTPSPTVTRTPTITRTLPNTPTDVWAIPESTPVYVGTSVADDSAVIGRENFEHLREVARWGRGDILDGA